MLLHTR